MKKFVSLCILAGLLLVSVTSPTFAQEAIDSVCLITDIGRVNDGTFNQFAYEGMARAVEEFDLETTYIETQSQTDYAANLQTCIDEGYDVIVVVGFSITDATVAAGEANPDVYFIGVDQDIVDGPENVVGVQFREDQSAFMVGALAAMVSESNVIGGVYGIDIPPVVRFRNGYEQGIEYMATLLDKDVDTLGVYIDDFQAPDRGAAAAEQFIGEGADVIFGAGGPTGSGGIAYAAAEGVYVIGVDQDEYYTTFGEGETPGAEYLITSAIKRVDVGVYDMISALVNGDMDAFPGGGNYILDVVNNGMTFSGPHDSDIPAAYYAILAEIQEALANGALITGVNDVTGEIEITVDEILEQSEFSPDLSALQESA